MKQEEILQLQMDGYIQGGMASDNLAYKVEKLSADKPAAEHFVTTFQEFIEDNQIFNL